MAMNKEKEKSKTQLILEEVFNEAVENLTRSDDGRQVSALLVQTDVVSGEIQIFDDRETLLAKNIIFEWAERSSKGLNPQRYANHILWVTLAALNKGQHLFDNPVFGRPFNVSIVDDVFNPQESLLTLREETFTEASEGRLMKNLDHELKNFYKKIFADTK
ncbi:MAG: hypothetical protein LBR18_00745 [Tannerella sp.]|jgi:hypothetical protein|nr:hypothetical protein [Tannerella sp.]